MESSKKTTRPLCSDSRRWQTTNPLTHLPLLSITSLEKQLMFLEIPGKLEKRLFNGKRTIDGTKDGISKKLAKDLWLKIWVTVRISTFQEKVKKIMPKLFNGPTQVIPINNGQLRKEQIKPINLFVSLSPRDILQSEKKTLTMVLI